MSLQLALDDQLINVTARSSRQGSYLLWVPVEARNFLCVIYEPCLIPLLLAQLGNQVYVTSPDKRWLARIEERAKRRKRDSLKIVEYSWDICSLKDTVEVAFVFGTPLDYIEMNPSETIAEHFQSTLQKVYSAVISGGRLLVALETPWGMGKKKGLSAGILRKYKIGLQIKKTIRTFVSQSVWSNKEIVHVFPSLSAPILIAPPGNSAQVKRLALSHHIGYRWLRYTLPLLFPLNRLFLPDFFTPAQLLVVDK